MGKAPAAVILTDLDGTLLEPNGRALPEVVAFLARLRKLGVVVCPLTSKTAPELAPILRELGLDAPAAVENGGALLPPRGELELHPKAVPVERLAAIFEELRERTGVPARSLLELGDEELAAITGLDKASLGAARKRAATLPLVVAHEHEPTLRGALPPFPPLRLVRGNRFLHLQGDHDKHDLVPRLLEMTGAEGLAVVACGDAPNDGDFLAAASVRVIVPSAAGPHPELVRRLPDATVAPEPHGRGWVKAVQALLTRMGIGGLA